MQSVAIALDSETLVSLDALREKAICFGHLLMLATCARIPLTSIKVCAGKTCMNLFGRYHQEDAENNLEIYGFNFKYTDIQDHFDEVVKGWFAFYEKHKESLNLYFGTRMQAQHMSMEIEFLRIVQSLESLHRTNHPDEQISKAPCRENHQRWTSLYKRLYDLFEIPYNVIDPTNKEKFVKQVTMTRNYYAHGGIKEHENYILSKNALYEATRKLKMLMFVHLIDGLKIPSILKETIVAKEIQRVYELERMNRE